MKIVVPGVLLLWHLFCTSSLSSYYFIFHLGYILLLRSITHLHLLATIASIELGLHPRLTFLVLLILVKISGFVYSHTIGHFEDPLKIDRMMTAGSSINSKVPFSTMAAIVLPLLHVMLNRWWLPWRMWAPWLQPVATHLEQEQARVARRCWSCSPRSCDTVVWHAIVVEVQVWCSVWQRCAVLHLSTCRCFGDTHRRMRFFVLLFHHGRGRRDHKGVWYVATGDRELHSEVLRNDTFACLPTPPFGFIKHHITRNM